MTSPQPSLDGWVGTCMTSAFALEQDAELMLRVRDGDAVSFGCEQYVESLPEIEAFIGQRIPVGSFDPADLPYLKSAHHAPRSYGDEADDGPPPSQIHRPPARQGQPGQGRGRRRPAR